MSKLGRLEEGNDCEQIFLLSLQVKTRNCSFVDAIAYFSISLLLLYLEDWVSEKEEEESRDRLYIWKCTSISVFKVRMEYTYIYMCVCV